MSVPTCALSCPPPSRQVIIEHCRLSRPHQNMPQISIIIPAYNSAAFILQTIASVQAQTFDDWELIVVNDGSGDDTESILKNVDPRVRVINQPNAGIATARNTGVKASIAPYIAFLDHDDLWHPQKLATQLACMQQNPDAGIVFGNFSRWESDTQPEFPTSAIDPQSITKELSGWIYHKLALTNWVLFSTVLIRRTVFDKIGLLDPKMPPADDWDFAVRASREFQFIKLEDVVALYRVHPTQTSQKIAGRNFEVEFRDRMIQQFGTKGPDGSEIDLRDVAARQFRGHSGYAMTHLRNGDPRIALNSFMQALRIRPMSPKIWLLAISAAIRLPVR